MAVQTVQNLPAQFIQDIGKDLATQITAQSGVPIVSTGIAGISQQPGETPEDFKARQSAAQQFTTRQQSLSGLAPQVAGQDALQAQAQNIAQAGVGSFAPFLTQAQQAATDAGTALGGVGLGAQAFQQGVQDFMSPFQSQVIDASLAEFDRNQQIQEQQIRDQQASLGVLGAGRAGVQLAEFGTGAARERALLQAGLLQQGFGQAAAARQQDIANRGALAAQQQGLGAFQAGLGAQQQAATGTDISRLGQLGALNQAQAQAQLDASREAARQATFLPQQQLDRFAGQVTGLMGGYPAQTQQTVTPNPSPLQTALGVGTTLAGIYGTIKGASAPRLFSEGGRTGYAEGTDKKGIMKVASGNDPLLIDEYNKYVFEMEEMGKEPMSFEQFKMMVLSGQG
tara:strand:- start:729 stop:1919 length:1191 start_codon:yes stop_codon:yes gene_type:complete